MKYIYIIIIATSLISCSQKKQDKSLTEGGMKCGAGKCGASMVDGSTLLGKKQMMILKELKEDDKRIECVKNSTTTKKLYNCVRDKKTGRLSINLWQKTIYYLYNKK